MPGLMILSATRRSTRLGLLGHVDHAHAPFADLLKQFVGADLRAGLFKKGLVAVGDDTRWWRLQKTPSLFVSY